MAGVEAEKYLAWACPLGAACCSGGQQRYPVRAGDSREVNDIAACCWGLWSRQLLSRQGRAIKTSHWFYQVLYAPKWLAFPWMKYSCWQLSIAAIWEIQRERRDFRAIMVLSGKEKSNARLAGVYPSCKSWRSESPKPKLRSTALTCG